MRKTQQAVALHPDRGAGNQAGPLLDEALGIARELNVAGTEVASLCRLALLPGGNVSAPIGALAVHAERLGPETMMEARFLLWRATQDPAHLDEAKRLLDYLVEHAPEDCRESMLQNVPLHRDITAAWAERQAVS